MRGQIATLDVVLGTMLLGVLLIALLSFIDAEVIGENREHSREMMEERASAAMDVLLLSRGSPENWSGADYVKIGLSCGQGKVCGSKLAELNASYSSNYSRLAGALGLAAYDFEILAYELPGYESVLYNITTPAMHAGRMNRTEVSRQERISSMDGNLVSIVGFFWSKS